MRATAEQKNQQQLQGSSSRPLSFLLSEVTLTTTTTTEVVWPISHIGSTCANGHNWHQVGSAPASKGFFSTTYMYPTSLLQSQERAISPAARTTLHQGGSNFACGANYPHQAIKGGCFVFVWRVGT